MVGIEAPHDPIGDLCTGTITSVVLLERGIARIAADDAALNIFVHLDLDGARRAASESDRRRRDGRPLSALDGVPIAVKANVAVAGMPYHGGIGLFRDRIAERDAACVAALRRSGVIILGMVNMHEAAFGATTDNPWFGRTLNPLDRERTAGGSSGGSAAAVAADFVRLAIGSDTVGSSRIPAAFTGTVGLKPRYDSIDSVGLMPMALGFDTIGLQAATIGECRQMFELMARRGAIVVPRHKVVALPTFMNQPPLQERVAEGLGSTVQRLEAANVRVKPIEVELDLPELVRSLAMICAGDAAALYPELLEAEHGVSDELKARLRWGNSHRQQDLVNARQALCLAEQQILSGLAGFDAWLLPTTPCVAPAFDDVSAAVASFTALANISHSAALAIPVATASSGLPVSVQLVGDDERLLLDIAEVASTDPS